MMSLGYGLVWALRRTLQSPTVLELCADVLLVLVPVWIAFLFGVVIGWAWKPRWANLGKSKLGCSLSKALDSPYPSINSKLERSPLKGFGSEPSLNSFKIPRASFKSCTLDDVPTKNPRSTSPSSFYDSSISHLDDTSTMLMDEDLMQLLRLVEMKDGGPPWIHMMDRYISGMSYQAWRRDPKDGPSQYRSRTVYEDATPEIVRDFFWDDDFRLKWDDMLAYSRTIQECPNTGTMVLHRIRKFPFFCSDREYIVARRIWESGRSYFCVTKGVQYPSIPRRNKPRRVDLFYSSCCIRAVESRKYDGQLSACEVLLFHYEDMGIPNEIAKFGVRQGMWGAVKKVEPGLRAYQKARASGATLLQPAVMTSINAGVSLEFFRSLEVAGDVSGEDESAPSKTPKGDNLSKVLLIGGIIALALSFNDGLLAKAAISGIAQRFASLGRRKQTQEERGRLDGRI